MRVVHIYFFFIKDNYVVVYELLDEMLDNGYPLATEANILKELIKPPNILRTVVNTVTGDLTCSWLYISDLNSDIPGSLILTCAGHF